MITTLFYKLMINNQDNKFLNFINKYLLLQFLEKNRF